MKPLPIHKVLAVTLVLATAQLCAGAPPVGRAVYRFRETVTITRCESPDSQVARMNCTRTGLLLLESRVSAGNWSRLLIELETRQTNAPLPLARSDLVAVDEEVREGRTRRWGASADGLSVLSSPENEDPMGEGAPLPPDALGLPTVLPARAGNDAGANTIRLRFETRILPVAYTVRSNVAGGQTITLTKKPSEQRGVSGVCQLQPEGQWTVTCAKDGWPDNVEGEFQLTQRQRWKADGQEHDLLIFSVASRFVYTRWPDVDFDNERIFEHTAPGGKNLQKP